MIYMIWHGVGVCGERDLATRALVKMKFAFDPYLHCFISFCHNRVSVENQRRQTTTTTQEAVNFLKNDYK